MDATLEKLIVEHILGNGRRSLVVKQADRVTGLLALHNIESGKITANLLAMNNIDYVKGQFTGGRPFRSAVQTTLIGSLAATATFGFFSLAKLISA